MPNPAPHPAARRRKAAATKRSAHPHHPAALRLKDKILTLQGLTLIELIIAVAIIGIIATFATAQIRTARELAAVSVAGFTQRQVTRAVELYYDRLGFYPPDVNRGWDPGLVKKTVSNPDIDAGGSVPNTAGVDCGHCPANWQTRVNTRWDGPYLERWPRRTPWGGTFDYNYWPQGATIGPCTVLPGLYIGVQTDYTLKNPIPPSAEQKMIAKGFDSEHCLNGQSQMLLIKF